MRGRNGGCEGKEGREEMRGRKGGGEGKGGREEGTK